MEILKVCAGLPEKTFSAEDVLLAEKAPRGPLYILTEGTVSVTKNKADVARISDPGAVFGEMSALLDTPVSATVTAVTDVRVRVFLNHQ